MEDHAKLLADLTAAVSSMNAKVDAMHRAVFNLHTRKPVIERSVMSPRAEVGELRARVIDITKPSSSTSPRGELPPLLPHTADAPPPAFPCKDNNIDTDAVYVAEAPLLADDASLPVPEQVEASRTPAVSSSFVLMFEPMTPARCSIKCTDEKANQEVTALGLGVTPVIDYQRRAVRSVPWSSNIGYLAGLHLKPPWPSWIESGERFQLPLVMAEVTSMGLMPQEDFVGDGVDTHQLEIFLFRKISIGEETKVHDIFVQVSATSFAVQMISYHADKDTRIGMEMSSISRELYVINLDDAGRFALQMFSSDVEKLKCLFRELWYIWQFNIDAHFSLFPWNPGYCLPGYFSRGLNFPRSYVLEELGHDTLGIVQIQDMLMAVGMERNVSDPLSQLLMPWFLGVLIERSTKSLQFSILGDVWVSSLWDPTQAVDDHQYIVEPYFTKIIYSHAFSDMCRKQRGFQSLQVLCSSCPRFLQFEELYDATGALLELKSWPYWQSYSLGPIEMSCGCHAMTLLLHAQPGMHELELNSCAFWVDFLLPLVLVSSPDGIIYFQDLFDYSHNKWLFDRKSDNFGLLQLVTEAASYDTSKNKQADYAATLTCSLGISCLAIAGGVGPLFAGTRAVYSEGGNRFRQPLSTDILYEQFHGQMAWSSQVLELCSAVGMTLGATACSFHQLRLGTVLLFVHEYWPGKFGCLQWDPGGICNASTELGWGQAEPQTSWECTYDAQLVRCSHMWKVASPRTTSKRYGQVSLLHLIMLTIDHVRVCWSGLDFDKVRTTWDPGGFLVHRLEGKPILKKGGMSRTRYALGRGPLRRGALAWETTG